MKKRNSHTDRDRALFQKQISRTFQGLFRDSKIHVNILIQINILQRHEKCQFYAFGDGVTGHHEAKY